jgi:hypothetical protein
MGSVNGPTPPGGWTSVDLSGVAHSCLTSKNVQVFERRVATIERADKENADRIVELQRELEQWELEVASELGVERAIEDELERIARGHEWAQATLREWKERQRRKRRTLGSRQARASRRFYACHRGATRYLDPRVRVSRPVSSGRSIGKTVTDCTHAVFFPGFSKFLGSKRSLICWCSSTARGCHWPRSSPRFTHPVPCSPEIEPPTDTA